VLDADVLFLRRTSFFLAVPTWREGSHLSDVSIDTERRTSHEAGSNFRIVPILTTGTEHNRPFFTHAECLLGGSESSEGLGKYSRGGQRHHPMMSGIAHHMPLVIVPQCTRQSKPFSTSIYRDFSKDVL